MFSMHTSERAVASTPDSATRPGVSFSLSLQHHMKKQLASDVDAGERNLIEITTKPIIKHMPKSKHEETL